MKTSLRALIILTFTSSISFAQVIISELSTDNSAYDDEDTDSPDWFELRNVSDATVDLDGWELSTREDGDGEWTIQSLTLAPGDVRLFFASGKDRPGTAETNDTYRPHTAFTLENAGGYLGLRRPDGSEAHALTYPPLQKDVSYGVNAASEGHFFPASPNAVNDSKPAPNGLTPRVSFSHAGGVLNGVIALTLSVPDHPEAKIRYALDGAEPSLFTPSYSGPIVIDRTQTITAVATLPDHLPSRLQTCSYILLGDDMTSFAETGKAFESNLPIIVIDGMGNNLDASREFRSSAVAVISPDKDTGRAILGETAPEYAGPCGVHLRGESSAGFGQKSYALELQDPYGEDQDASLLGMPAESDWALYGPWSEKSLMRNKLIFDWMRALRGADGTSMRSEFCEVFIDQGARDEALSYGSYQGIYLLMEKIKGGRNRVPIENINEHTTDPHMITGGYIIRRDKVDSGKDSWSTSLNQPLQSFDPDRFSAVQLAYVKAYINNFERALRSDNFTDPTKGYRKYIDPSTFIDAQWFVEISRQVDGYVFSTYWHKDRHGLLRAGPLWDFNISLGNADYATGDRPEGWLYDNRNGHGQIWYPDLHKDPEYHMAHWDRYWHMRHGMLSDDAVIATIDGHMHRLLDGYTEPIGNREPESVQNPVARHFRKYPFIGTRQWPNPPAESRIRTYQGEIDYLKDWLLERLAWIDDQSFVVDNKIHRAPKVSHPAGALDDPTDIEIIPHKGSLFTASKFPQETIYYTTDGTDPRLPGGDLNPSAVIYDGPIAIGETTTIETRLLNGTTWSPKTSATYLLHHAPASSNNLIISEIMYHPTDPTSLEAFSGLNESHLFEYLELTNTSNRIVDLSGTAFTNGIHFQFDSLTPQERLLQPGQTVLLVSHLPGFQRRHGDVDLSLVLGEYKGKLSNDGEGITLSDASGDPIIDLNYNDGQAWPAEADGLGKSLVWANQADAQEADAWLASTIDGGTPGTHPLDASGEPTGDSDRDGVLDTVEMVFGSDPQDPQSVFLPQLTQDADGNWTLEQRHRSGLESSLSIQGSHNLTDWAASSLGAPTTATLGNDVSLTRWPLVDLTESPRFLRVISQ